VYNKHELKDIRVLASLSDGGFTFRASSPSPLLNFDISGTGDISENDYKGDITAILRNVDLQALGMSETPNAGSATIHVAGSAAPRTWIYDVGLDLSGVDWLMGADRYVVRDSVSLKLNSGASDTRVLLNARGADAELHANSGLQTLIDKFSTLGAMLPKMIESRRLDMEAIEQTLPGFTLTADAAGSGIASEFLGPAGMSFGDFSMRLEKDSLISGDMRLQQLSTGSMSLDTITLGLQSRGNLLDYKIHLGNRPGTLDEFAQVNMSGYAGENRLSAFLNQHNIKGKNGYRLGFTASLADSIASVRFTPLKATIAYLPWVFNMDNYVDVNINNFHLNANLLASSDNSSILLKTEPGTDGKESLHLNLKNIRVEDFLQMALNAPPVKANINSDMRVRYTGRALVGKGNLDISDLYYDRQRVGDFNFTLQAGMGKSGKSAGKVGLLVDNKEAAAVQFVLAPDSVAPDKGLIAERLKLVLTEFPLSIANPFFPPRTMKLSGALNGDMSLSGSFTNPKLNGNIACHDASLFFNMLGTNFKFGGEPITVVDNVLDFNNFEIKAVNDNPLTIRGTVDARKLTDMKFDLSADAGNMQLVGGKNSNSDMTGKLFVDLNASVKGPMSMMDVNAYLNVLPATDVTYTMEMASDALSAGKRAEGMVEFVNFNDTTQVVKTDTVSSTLAMRIVAKAVISQGAQVCVNLGDDGKVECSPSGTLNYFQNFLGDMKLNGTLYTGSGLVNYTIPYVQKKFTFDFDRNSHITWNGDIMNPALDIDASNTVKANIQMGGNTRLVNFLVNLDITNTLSAPSVVFGLSTDDDVSISNELQAMTPDQRQQQAISLLLTGMYSGPSAKTVGGNLVSNGLYGVLTSTLNTLAANAIKGVDINFGVDQYQTGNNGNTSTATSYSYQVSKSLINNRFKIVVGGNYTTGSADENFEQNLISDIAFEYILKQTNNMSLNARLYRHTGFESVLEGEITETGVGLSLRRRLAYFTEITHFGLSKLWKKKKPAAVPDSVQPAPEKITLPADSLQSTLRKEDENEE
ncbi:MAG: translocation/assembly module TamB, partial [Muribaculaceae bacterium]|nr:translocation/assembly module TamB [Muribaculaceae bacterium]